MSRGLDNKTGSIDKYVKFEDPDVFGMYYADQIKRNFPNAMNTGPDVSPNRSTTRPTPATADVNPATTRPVAAWRNSLPSRASARACIATVRSIRR